jgi:hypothetical protein
MQKSEFKSKLTSFLATSLSELQEQPYKKQIIELAQKSSVQPILPTLVHLVAGATNPEYNQAELDKLAMSLHLSGFATVIFDDILLDLAVLIGFAVISCIGITKWLRWRL